MDRLRPRDLAFLHSESASTPMHNATVEIFSPGESGFGYDALLALIEDRIAFVPRYRQLLVDTPGRLANPAWLDDPDFDLTFHVRRSAVPAPGTGDQLRELVGRIVSRPLDRNKPLWEMYLIEGLEGGRVALLSKSHQILVDGVETVDLGQVLLDVGSEPRKTERDDWRPRHRPNAAGLMTAALRDSVRDPRTAIATGRGVLDRARSVAAAAGEQVGAATAALPLLPGVANAPESPISGEHSRQRLVATLSTDLADYRKVRDVHGGTVNDVILATVTGGMRTWLMSRESGRLRPLRAMVPMSVIDDELEATSLGTQIAGHLVQLPVGEASPVMRLHQVSYAFKAHNETGRAVAANRLAGIAGFAPTTFHALGSRVAAQQQRKGFQIAVTNVPGPQFPLFAAGAEMTETYPVHPLLPGHTLAIGVTSYGGRVFYGLTADRRALPDVDVLVGCLADALDELVDTTRSRRGARRGRSRTTKGK